jgi:hypothetical protein
MKLAEIAAGIRAHLKRFEADPVINASKDGTRGGLTPFYNASAGVAGRYVWVRYVSFRGPSHLTREDATAFLCWLDAGNVGRHYAALSARAVDTEGEPQR